MSFRLNKKFVCLSLCATLRIIYFVFKFYNKYNILVYFNNFYVGGGILKISRSSLFLNGILYFFYSWYNSECSNNFNDL